MTSFKIRSQSAGLGRAAASRRGRRRAASLALLAGTLCQAGCAGFWQRELEALFAPDVAGNAVYVLDSVLFDLLAPLFY